MSHTLPLIENVVAFDRVGNNISEFLNTQTYGAYLNAFTDSPAFLTCVVVPTLMGAVHAMGVADETAGPMKIPEVTSAMLRGSMRKL